MEIDIHLQLIVAQSLDMQNRTEGRVETGITLLVGGLLVSGHIISARDFFMSHPLTDKTLEILDRLHKQEPIPNHGSSDELPEFIHLSDVHFFVPGQPPIPTCGDGVFWRGRISEVAGFQFGILKLGTPGEADHVG